VERVGCDEPAKVDEVDYINFLIAAQRTFTCKEASRSQPAGSDPGAMSAHDSFNRLLERSFLDRESLWDEARRLVRLDGGVLVVDDTTLDKPYAEKMDLVTRHWSGKHHRVVMGDKPHHDAVDRRRQARTMRLPGLR